MNYEGRVDRMWLLDGDDGDGNDDNDGRQKWDLWNDSVIKNEINGHLCSWVIQVQSCLVTDLFLVQ